jgi:hypothetical protein
MTSYVKYTATQGIDWDRLVVVKDRRTRRVIRPIECWARIKTGDMTVAPIRTLVTSEGAILLSLTAEETKSLPVGELEFDVIAKHSKRQSLAYGSLTTYPGVFEGATITRPVASGIIKVEPLDTVTSLEQETQVEIRFKKGEDYRITYSWKDHDGDLVPIKDAYMQAKNGDGSTALDIRWFADTPNEDTVVALPGIQRGYLAPLAGVTMELHISDANTIAPGTYRYDIFVQELSDDWTPFTAGTLIVEQSVSTRPS